MRIGIMGGTFNPPHTGHINAANVAKKELSLDKLIFIPTALPPHKELAVGSATALQRLEMTRLAAELAGAETSDIEISRGGKSYTADTLKELIKLYPGDQLWLIMGTDMFMTLEEWKTPEKIFELAKIAVIPRCNGDREMLLRYAEKLLEKYGAATRIIDAPAVTISSSELRMEKLTEEQKKYIPEKVMSYITENKLYSLEADKS